MKTIIINQYNKIGDILFVLRYAQALADAGYNVIFPVDDHIMSIAKYLPKVTLIPRKYVNIDYESNEYIENGNTIILPLRFSNTIINKGQRLKCQQSKHDMFKNMFPFIINWDISEWRQSFINMAHIYDQRYEYMAAEYAAIRPVQPVYNLINQNYSTGHNQLIMVNNGYMNLYVDNTSRNSIFDWSHSILKAEEFHTVSTCFVFLVEILKSNNYFDKDNMPKLHLYPRSHEPNVLNILPYISKEWIIHE